MPPFMKLTYNLISNHMYFQEMQALNSKNNKNKQRKDVFRAIMRHAHYLNGVTNQNCCGQGRHYKGQAKTPIFIVHFYLFLQPLKTM